MKKIFLLSLILTFNIFAQETEDKYMMLKPLSWDELQLYQLDSLLSVEELNLSTSCPATLKKLQTTHERTGQHFQHILGTNYIWSEYTNKKELKCFVKHVKIDSITQKDNEIINPNNYELLNTTQARILKSASQGIGFEEKGLNEKFRQARIHNQKIQDKPYVKYGGLLNVVNYMEKHEPSFEIDPIYLKNRTTVKNGSVVTKHIPLIQIFEMRYSDEQKQKLIEISRKMEEEKKSQK